MAKYSLRELLGLTGSNKTTSGKSRDKRKTASSGDREGRGMDFSHLNKSTGAYAASDELPEQSESDGGMAPDIAGITDKGNRVREKHTRGHNVAVSDEAKKNPVLAVKLLRSTKLSSSEIIRRLKEEPEAITAFTEKFMSENVPEWEFVSEEDKGKQAMAWSVRNDDKNGYNAGRNAARRVLDGMRDPYLTTKEIERSMEDYRKTSITNPGTSAHKMRLEKINDEYLRKKARARVEKNIALKDIGHNILHDELDEEKVFESMKKGMTM